MLRSHTNLWFHYIEAWTGKFFKRYDLVSLGFIIHLGHEGLPCPHQSPAQDPSNFVIGHSNGIHDCQIHYCSCPGAPDKVTQLLRARLWPATRNSPHSAFTLSLLRTWHQLWLNAKISTHHFMRALTRYTNNAFPHDVKVRMPIVCSVVFSLIIPMQDHTREFRFVSRLYAHLTMVKRSGYYHKMSIPNRDPEDITVPCVACPSPGFNLPEGWRDTPEHLRYVLIKTCMLV